MVPEIHWFLSDQNFFGNHSFIDYILKTYNDIAFRKNKETQRGQKKHHSQTVGQLTVALTGSKKRLLRVRVIT